MDKPREPSAKWNNSDTERQTLWFHLYMESKIAKLREGERRMNDSFQGQHREEDMKRHWSKGAKFQFCKVNKFWRFKACIHACSVTQLSPTLCDPKDCVSSVHGIILARILEWVAISSSRRSSWPRYRTHVSCVSCTGKQILYHWTWG